MGGGGVEPLVEPLRFLCDDGFTVRREEHRPYCVSCISRTGSCPFPATTSTATGEIRTHTDTILNRAPLPIGLPSHSSPLPPPPLSPNKNSKQVHLDCNNLLLTPECISGLGEGVAEAEGLSIVVLISFSLHSPRTATGGSRTHTVAGLNRVPLPIGPPWHSSAPPPPPPDFRQSSSACAQENTPTIASSHSGVCAVLPNSIAAGESRTPNHETLSLAALPISLRPRNKTISGCDCCAHASHHRAHRCLKCSLSRCARKKTRRFREPPSVRVSHQCPT